MSSISAALRREVVKRAKNRCEYCRLSQKGQEASFHIDHIVPRVAAGPSKPGNLALSCVSCSLRKGAKLQSTDPKTGKAVEIFHPRLNNWSDHFLWKGHSIFGKTSCGRATVRLLGFNRPIAIAIRKEEEILGRHPPE